MSYARWSDGSAVYVYADSHGGLACCGCALHFEDDDESGELSVFGQTQHFYSVEDAIEHFREHIRAGHTIPPDLLEEDTYEPGDFEHR